VQTEEQGSVSPNFQDRRREDAFFEEPHNGKLNNIYDRNTYEYDIDSHTPTHDDDDDHISYDIDDVFGNKNECVDGLNPAWD
jgi:hypothetical protein